MARSLNPEELRKPCDPGRFRFATTSEVARSRGSSARGGTRCDRFRLDMRSLGFNIYVLGESGTGKTSAIRSFVSEKAKADPVPPIGLTYSTSGARRADRPFPDPGRGAEFQGDMRELVDYLRSEIRRFRLEGVRAAKGADRRGFPEPAERDFRLAGGRGEIEGLQRTAHDQRIFHRRGGRFGRADDGREVRHRLTMRSGGNCATTGCGSRNGWTTWSAS